MKTCIKCRKTKPVSDYYRNHGNQCKSCLNEQAKQWGKLNHEKRKAIQRKHYHKQGHQKKRAWVLQRHFGLTVAQYEAMLQQQNGVCAICQEAPKNGKQLAVDHDHKSQINRGLLCAKCNQALGLFHDNEDILLMAASYLLRYRQLRKVA